MVQLESLLGAGTHGTVLKGRWGSRSVAAKMFRITTSEDNLEDIAKDIAVLTRLCHQHIIRFHDVAYYQDKLAFLTDLAEGGSLREAIHNGLIQDWSTKVRLAREISLGLAYIHSQDVLHTDLKSENVLLSSSMEVKLCDTGCAHLKAASAATSASFQNGAVRWMAPELFDQQSEHTTKSDMYSFGMVMWEMATNSTIPFNEYYDYDAVIALVKDGKRENLPTDTPEGYRAWVEQCWDQDPSKRPEASEFTLGKDEAADSNGAKTAEEDHDTTSTLEAGLDSLSISTAPAKQKSKKGKKGRAAKARAKRQQRQAASNSASSLQNKPTQTKKLENGANDVEGITQETLKSHPRASYMDVLSTLYFLFGMKYLKGESVQQSEAKASEWLLKAAALGNPEIQTTVGRMYLMGEGVAQNDSQGVKWITEAANQGYAEGQYYLGIMFMEGEGVKKDEAKAFEWFLKAGEQGEVGAQFLVGMQYACGQGTKKNEAESLKWLTKAANQGHPDAQSKVGMIYLQGRGVKKDDAEAVKWLTMAATQGILNAQFNLGAHFNDEQIDTRTMLKLLNGSK
ncbi:hypothetical protein BGW41_005018 [Actinomortierella wolfii]|nr:hypothetical protein BGW41_005018 [Actinomortierella wolfii]